jgi:hypothetical protein
VEVTSYDNNVLLPRKIVPPGLKRWLTNLSTRHNNFIFLEDELVLVLKMSSLLKEMLDKVAEEDFKKEKEEIEQRARRGLPRFKSLILAIKKQKIYDLVVLAEGSTPTGIKKIEKDLNMLERANLIKGEMKFTRRNTYRRYVLTKKGDALAESLLKEG